MVKSFAAEYRKLCKDCRELQMLGMDATLDLWAQNIEVSTAVEEYITGTSSWKKKSAKLEKKLAECEAEIQAFSDGTSDKSAESLYKDLNKIQLYMDMNFIDYTPSSDLIGYDAVLAGL